MSEEHKGEWEENEGDWEGPLYDRRNNGPGRPETRLNKDEWQLFPHGFGNNSQGSAPDRPKEEPTNYGWGAILDVPASRNSGPGKSEEGPTNNDERKRLFGLGIYARNNRGPPARGDGGLEETNERKEEYNEGGNNLQDTTPNMLLNLFAKNWFEPINGEYPKTNGGIVANGNCFFHALGIATKEIHSLRMNKKDSPIPEELIEKIQRIDSELEQARRKNKVIHQINLNELKEKYESLLILNYQLFDLRTAIADHEIFLKKWYFVNVYKKLRPKYKLYDNTYDKIGYTDFMYIKNFIGDINKKDYPYSYEDIIFTAAEKYNKYIFLILTSRTNIIQNMNFILNYRIIMNKMAFNDPAFNIKNFKIIILIHLSTIHFETFYFEDKLDLEVRLNNEFVAIIERLIKTQKAAFRKSAKNVSSESLSIETFNHFVQIIEVPNNTFDFFLNAPDNAIVKSALKPEDFKKHFIKTDVNGLISFKVDPNMHLPKPHVSGSPHALPFFSKEKTEALYKTSINVFGPHSKVPSPPMRRGDHSEKRSVLPPRKTAPTPAPPMPTPKSIFGKIQFKQYSVWGETGRYYDAASQYKREYILEGEIDFKTTALVDAGGLNFFHGERIKHSENRKPAEYSPHDAGGSSGEMYRTFLQIGEDHSFHRTILDQIKGIGDSAFYKYTNVGYFVNENDAVSSDYCYVIHAIGPDFRATSPNAIIRKDINISKELTLLLRENFKSDFKKLFKPDVIALLSIVYYNIFKKFIDNKTNYGLKALNIVPISVGIFAGSVFNENTEIETKQTKADATMNSILKALEMMEKNKILQELDGIQINICLWNDIEKVGKILNCKREQSLCYMYNEAKKKILSTPRGGHFNSQSIKRKYNKIIKKRTLRKKNKTHKKVKLYKI